MTRGEGVDRLLEYWLRANTPEPAPLPSRVERSTRMIDLLMVDDGGERQ